jgi:hypothetical protein
MYHNIDFIIQHNYHSPIPVYRGKIYHSGTGYIYSPSVEDMSAPIMSFSVNAHVSGYFIRLSIYNKEHDATIETVMTIHKHHSSEGISVHAHPNVFDDNTVRTYHYEHFFKILRQLLSTKTSKSFDQTNDKVQLKM